MYCGWPAWVAPMSFIKNGTPRRGPSGSAARAARRASSNSGLTIAPSSGSRRSLRAIAASTSSSGVSSLLGDQRGLRDGVEARQGIAHRLLSVRSSGPPV